MFDPFDWLGHKKAKRLHEEAVLARHKKDVADRAVSGLLHEIKTLTELSTAHAKHIDRLRGDLCRAQLVIADLAARNRRLRENRGLPTLRRLDSEGKV